MNKLLIHAHQYWELHWLYNIASALDIPVYSEDPTTKTLIKSWGLRYSDAPLKHHILISCVFHMGENHQVISDYINHQKPVVLLQHAWDSQIQCINPFWGLDTTKFTLYLTGCTQDEGWLKRIHGHHKIFNLGMPKLDDLHTVAQPNHQVDHIYKMLGVKKFFLADLPPASIYEKAIESAYIDLPNHSPLPIIFKMHPGGHYPTGAKWLKKHHPNVHFIDDNISDRLATYQLIKASSGVINLESFLSIEASLLKKPVIFYQHHLLPKDYFTAQDRIYGKDRLPKNMSSSLHKPELTPAQKHIVKYYRCDGNNTYRVIQLLTALQSMSLENLKII